MIVVSVVAFLKSGCCSLKRVMWYFEEGDAVLDQRSMIAVSIGQTYLSILKLYLCVFLSEWINKIGEICGYKFRDNFGNIP